MSRPDPPPYTGPIVSPLRAPEPVVAIAPTYEDRWLQVFGGDCREVLRALPAESVHCVVTSPPYWGLRDYGLPPAAWGGDLDHAHLWGVVERGKRKDILPPDQSKSKSPHGSDARGVVPLGAAGRNDGGRFCECGAWLGCLGLEPSPDLYVEHLVDVFREVRRVLRRDGTAWLNLGDSFASDGKWGGSTGGKHVKALHGQSVGRARRHTGLKPKDLVGVPWLAAFALRDDGWWLRRDIVWSKPNPMPESTEDRPTSAHEYVFLLAKSERYYYDADAIREPFQSGPSDLRKMVEGRERIGGLVKASGDPLLRASGLTNVGRKRSVGDPTAAAAALAEIARDRRPSGWAESDDRSMVGRYPDKRPAGWNDGATSEDRRGRYKQDVRQSVRGGDRTTGLNARWDASEDAGTTPLGRNKRSVWTIATQPYPGAHFATFPTELVRPMILAGAPERVCSQCGAAWRRIVVPTGHVNRRELAHHIGRSATKVDSTGWAPTSRAPDQWEASCAHAAPVASGVVLDPFGGTGTVGLVAQQEGRRAVLIDLNPDYLRQCLSRTSREWGVGGKVLEDAGTEPHPEDSLWAEAAG